MLVLTFGFSFAVFAKVQVGVVDIQKVLMTVDEGAAIMKQLEKTYNNKKAKLKKEESRIKKDQEKYQKQLSILSGKARAKKEREMQADILKLQNTTMQYQREMQELEQKLKKPLIEKVRSIVETVAKNSKVDFCFEASSSPLLYAESKKDITLDVIKEYNKKHPKK